MAGHKISRLERLLEEEIELLLSLILRSSKQHKASLVIRRASHLHRTLRKPICYEPQKKVVVESCKNLYTVCSCNMTMEYFIPLNLAFMGVSARIYYIIARLPTRKKTAIDDIWDRFS